MDSLVKNLMDDDFKYFPEEFSGEFLRLVKQKGVVTAAGLSKKFF